MNNDVIKVQLSCGVDYYKGDKGDKPVKGVDYFTQEDIADIVEQIETGGIDLDGYATKEYVDNAVSGVVVSETDPTVPEWAKQASKPTYTAQEVGALPANTELFSGDYNDLSNKPTIPEVPVNVSAFNNDAGYLTNVEFHDTMNMTSVSVNSAGLYVETLDNEQNPVYRTDVINMGVSANGPSGVVAMSNGQLMFGEPTNGNMLTVSINENADSLYVNGDKVALVNDIPNLTDYATESYVATAIANIDIPAPIVIECAIAGQPTPDSDGGYTLPLTITSNNMAEAYEQFQTHPSTVGISVDLSAMEISTKMYMDCESFYRADDGNGGYNYETYGEFNDSSLAWRFGFEFDNVNIYLSTETNSSEGTLTGIATVHQLASKANSADLATVATSGDYNDLTNKPTIPTAYTLPTATTSTLGGVKVDGSTITIDANGVISSSASGGSYTFINGLTENNGTVSWDLNSRIRAGSGSDSVVIGNNNTASGYYAFAEGSSNQATGLASHAEGYNNKAKGAYSHAEGSSTIASGSNQHAEGKYNVEDSNSIFQNIAGNGTSTRSTMFARDWNGNEYLSGNLFVGCNDFTTTANGLTTANAGGSKVATESYVATAIANIPSSGSNYTAGNGIDIDSNGVISRTDIGLTGMPLFASGFINNFSFGDTPSASTLSQLAENLKKYGISKYSGDNFTTTALNEAMGGTRYITQFLSGDIVPDLNWSVNTYNSTLNVGSWGWRDTPCFVIGENNKIYGTTSFSKLRMLISWNLGELIHLNVSQLSNLTTSTDIRRLPNLMSDINNVIGDINTRIPSAPTTDGDYVLKVSVSSGTPTYSWVSAT